MVAKKYFVWPSRGGLLLKTAFAIIWMALVTGALSLMLTLSVTRDRAERNAAREFSELLDTVENTVRIACYLEDEVLATEVVRGLLKNSKILRAAIRVNDRELARSDRAFDETGESFGSAAIQQLTRRVVSPFNPELTVGEIVLDPDPAAIFLRIADDAKFVGWLLGAQWVAICGGLLILLLLTVVRPIKTISDGLHRMDAAGGEQLNPPAGQEGTEIGRLVEDINALAVRLVAEINHATEQARQLQEAKDQVDAQSRLLAAKNITLARAMQVQEEVERIARHDLKTPLSSIAAIPALLRRNWQPGKNEEALLSMIENSARRVLRMVSLSLDLYKMEEGTYVFRPKTFDIDALVLAVTRDLAEEARARSVVFQIEGARLPVFVRAEEVLCYSILANLLKNAVEAAPEGSLVRISITVGNTVRLCIHNAGAVPLPVRGSFFEKYATYGKSQGTGLGTYSARLMAHVQQGELTMETDETVGTTLRLELLLEQRRVPRETSDIDFVATTVVPDVTMAIPALRILLVDDDPDNTLIMKLFLPSPPLLVETAGNGREAVAACRLRRPDVIFMDLEMPVMGGFEALKQIRALQEERDDAPSRIVAFSAHDDEVSRLRSVGAGFDLHLSKPCSQREILALLCDNKFHRSSADPLVETLPEISVLVDDDIYDVIPAFLESRRTLVAALRQALAAEAREPFRQLAHKLKGGFSMYGFRWAAEICRGLENDYQNPESKTLVLQVDALEQHLAQVRVRSRAHQIGRVSH